MRDLGKKLGFLRTPFDSDGRMRTSLNIAGTDTGRFSSRFSALGTGSNLQNVENQLRRPFISDDNRIFINVDLEQADARNVGARIWQIFYHSHGAEEAGKFLDACESGDLHTRVTSMAWKELPWPESWDATTARSLADSQFVPGTSYRDMAKKLGHGTNYFGTPPTMAMHTKTPRMIIEDFQRRYFTAFPLIGNIDKALDRDDWHSWIFQQLKSEGFLDNLFGRRRHFLDRPSDKRTIRAAIAYDPQSSTGEFLDRGWLNLWDNMPQARLHLPVHDSILFSLPITKDLSGIVEEALRLLQVSITLAGGRQYSIPLEAKVGFNWGDAIKDKKTGTWTNAYGLRKWTGEEDRERPKIGRGLTSLLDRPFHS
jgi:DNA polymerase I-like protein with 3'-5' exonuclease and polymerase domains